MSDQFDEFSKSVAEQFPRRESLRRFGAIFVGAVFAPLGLDAAVKRAVDPCKAFCKCSDRAQKNACLTACKACNNDPTRLSGSCGSYTCCEAGQSACGGYCTDLSDDFYNCGSCGNNCGNADYYESSACVSGKCEYWCVDGAEICDGRCTPLDQDYENCGACGNICAGSTPYCNNGVCSECSWGTNCDGRCVDLSYDNANCGACGNVCGGSTPYCSGGLCRDSNCGGRDLLWDSNNCGVCGYVCPWQTYCVGGVCTGGGDGDGYGY